MTLVDQVHVIKDIQRTAPSRTIMFPIPIDSEYFLYRDCGVFEIHQVGNDLLLLRWHVDILMGTVRSQKFRRLSSTDSAKIFYASWHV